MRGASLARGHRAFAARRGACLAARLLVVWIGPGARGDGRPPAAVVEVEVAAVAWEDEEVVPQPHKVPPTLVHRLGPQVHVAGEAVLHEAILGGLERVPCAANRGAREAAECRRSSRSTVHDMAKRIMKMVKKPRPQQAQRRRPPVSLVSGQHEQSSSSCGRAQAA